MLVVALSALLLAPLGGCHVQQHARQEQAVSHYVRGQLLLERGDLDAALAELSHAVAFDPDLVVALTSIGDVHRRTGRHDLAVDSYRSACAADPYAFRPHYNLGVTYQLLADTAHALETIQANLRLAVQTYLRALAIRPEDFDSCLNLSACYFRLGQHTLAEQYCLAALRANPDRPEPHSNLGVIYDALNRPHDAIEAYKNSLERDTHQPELLLNLAATYVRLGWYKQATVTLGKAAEEDPRNPAPHEQAGSCWYHLRDMDLAESAFRQALTLDPASPRAHRGLGVVCMYRYLNDRRRTDLREQALASWRTSLELDPAQADLHRLLDKYAPPTGG